MFAAIEVCQQIRRVAGRWVNATFCGPAEVFLVGQNVFPLPWAPGWRHGHHRASGGISITSSTCRPPEDLGQFSDRVFVPLIMPSSSSRTIAVAHSQITDALRKTSSTTLKAVGPTLHQAIFATGAQR